jgi:hypothetical protein
MLKNTTYQEKFAMLKKWLPEILEPIKKDLKNDHLKRDIQFVRIHFPSKNVNKLTLEELSFGYETALSNKTIAEELGEFIANRWLLKNTELYYFFEDKLKNITSDFQDLDTLEETFSQDLASESAKRFGAKQTLFFSVLNAVVFPKKIYDDLMLQADAEHKHIREIKEEEEKHKTWHEQEKAYKLMIGRLEDKYEKKLLGLRIKYDKDTEALKKQVSMLQKKLHQEVAL